MRRTLQTTALTFVAAAALTGCALSGTAGSDDRHGKARGSASEAAAKAPADASPEPTTASPRALGEPIATVEAPATVDGDPAATLSASLYSLERDGDTVVATYGFTVDSSASEEPETLSGYLGGRVWQPYLVDQTNLEKYEPLGADTPVRMATSSHGEFVPGATYYAYAVFPAPPEDVAQMDASILDGTPVASGVELR